MSDAPQNPTRQAWNRMRAENAAARERGDAAAAAKREIAERDLRDNALTIECGYCDTTHRAIDRCPRDLEECADRYTVAPFGTGYIILDGSEPREHPSGGLTSFRTAEAAQEVTDALNATD